MIVKIQKPLDAPLERALAYNQSRTFLAMLPYGKVASYFKNGAMKVYVKAKLSDTDGIEPIQDKQHHVLASLQTSDVTEHKTTDARLIIEKRVADRAW